MRRLLTTLVLLLACGAPAALPAQAAPFPAPVLALAAFTSYTTTAAVSNAAPRQNSSVTVSGTRKSGGKPVAGVPMTATWRYKTTISFCTGVTKAAGVASCSRRISRATTGYPVRVTLVFAPAGRTAVGTAVTSFTAADQAVVGV
ncbi:MAG: hypothetical protein M3Z04_00265 [Chloroflexota bacterium]|nr:hypothetical protein [Chloroflexota bacterium]